MQVKVNRKKESKSWKYEPAKIVIGRPCSRTTLLPRHYDVTVFKLPVGNKRAHIVQHQRDNGKCMRALMQMFLMGKFTRPVVTIDISLDWTRGAVFTRKKPMGLLTVVGKKSRRWERKETIMNSTLRCAANDQAVQERVPTKKHLNSNVGQNLVDKNRSLKLVDAAAAVSMKIKHSMISTIGRCGIKRIHVTKLSRLRMYEVLNPFSSLYTCTVSEDSVDNDSEARLNRERVDTYYRLPESVRPKRDTKAAVRSALRVPSAMAATAHSRATVDIESSYDRDVDMQIRTYNAGEFNSGSDTVEYQSRSSFVPAIYRENQGDIRALQAGSNRILSRARERNHSHRSLAGIGLFGREKKSPETHNVKSTTILGELSLAENVAHKGKKERRKGEKHTHNMTGFTEGSDIRCSSVTN
ncbi:hypothetical protein BDY19DRAFT_903482 [Irpex rosettiformis]|uniref:Uncharacterized protein n=1 Tax=Irpex rosettiformis TaxID=378272 RepID=A0ACB8UEF4_9APHY|nr:hypothetical protein BDY19DRAFT_903482 [Irpex rosettiformis]